MVCGRVGVVAKRFDLCVNSCNFSRGFSTSTIITARKKQGFEKNGVNYEKYREKSENSGVVR